MPYYSYEGVNLKGETCRGRIFAAHQDALEAILFKHDVALVNHKQASTLLLPAVKLDTTRYFFERLAILLESGVLVPEALAILRDHMGHVRLQLVLEDITNGVMQGHNLSGCLGQHKKIFDERMVHMVYVGQESGGLAVTVQALAAYLETVIDFRSKIKAAATGPLVSFLFFLVIVAIIVIGIIPTFASVINSSGQQLPGITAMLLSVSEFVTSVPGIICIGVVIMAAVLVIRRLLLSERFCYLCDGLFLRVPYLGSIIRDTQRAWFFDSLALLMRGGMQLVPALSIAQHSLNNRVLAQGAKSVTKSVAGGCSLSFSLDQCPGNLFPLDTIAMIRVGEDSGTVVKALATAAQISRLRALRSLSFVTTFIQPAMLIILGLLITLLIIAIYAPMLTISASIA